MRPSNTHTLARVPRGGGGGGGHSNPSDTTVDPDCAICHAAPHAGCGCESKAMLEAVRDAENRVMKPSYRSVKEWARQRAQDYVLQYFSLLSDRRKAEYHAVVGQLHANAARYSLGALPHPADMRAARAELRRGINEDWKASVTRYPDVLDYFFSLVKVKFPNDNDARVRDPPLSAMNGMVRGRGGAGGGR
ncbi:hypothetical protein Micbo1qcDRAFT_167845 [Microdochium bolleyi]|uniref:Uncharacterized protein n=1 Tax=Microdochium bolleyi TaxID=196109 RepID=A0A136IQE1_9PEZI|nr:hypothetical protein Micbo1qcDRAFT_167845 [Microdochium bolleyi]